MRAILIKRALLINAYTAQRVKNKTVIICGKKPETDLLSTWSWSQTRRGNFNTVDETAKDGIRGIREYNY